MNEILNRALAGVREQYVTRARQLGASQLANVVQTLTAAGWDFEKCYPYPSGRDSRKQYRLAISRRSFASKFVHRPRYISRSPKSPDPVELRPDALMISEREFVGQANACVDSYISKLEMKIEAPIKAAWVFGADIWAGSTLRAELQDGSQQVWTTRCILNVSCLGKLFNQWPTRRVA